MPRSFQRVVCVGVQRCGNDVHTIGEPLEVSFGQQPLELVVQHAAWVAPVVLEDPHPLELSTNLGQLVWICGSGRMRSVAKKRAPLVHSLAAGEKEVGQCDGHIDVGLLIGD